MKQPAFKIWIAIFVAIPCSFFQARAQSELSAQLLNAKQKSIITISALTAKGDLPALQKALTEGLEARVTVNETKEVLVHLYAYCGFPRSIRGLQTLMSVLEERKARGIADRQGNESAQIVDARSKYERGRETLYRLTGTPQDAAPTGYSQFAPAIDTFLKEHLFADIFERNILSYAERELVTISVLSALGGVEPMLRSHLNICLNVGLTPEQLRHFISIIESTLGKKTSKETQSVLDDVIRNFLDNSRRNP